MASTPDATASGPDATARSAPGSPALSLRLASLVNVIVFLLVTGLATAVALPAQLLAWPFDPQRRVSNTIAAVCWGRLLVAVAPLWHVTRTGTERLDALAPCILVANHQSMLDIPLLLGLGRPVRVVARPGVFRIPGIGWMARLSGHLEVDPSDAASAEHALHRAGELLAAGISVVVFPEGTRGEGAHLLPFHRGAFELALRTGAPVVPVVIAGTSDAMPRGSLLPRRVRCRFHVQVLDPLTQPDVPGVRDSGAPPPGGALPTPAPPGRDLPMPAARRQLASAARERMAAALAGPRPWALSEAVARRYLAQGRWRYGWAWGKTSFDPVYFALHERLPMEGRLIDLGAGEGLLAAYLTAAGHRLHYEGYDIDAERIDVARRISSIVHDGPAREPTPRFVAADARTVDLGIADAIVCIDVLHYLSPADQAGLLSRMCAALRPGGILLVRDPEVRGGHRARTALTVGSERLLVATGRHATGRQGTRRGETPSRVSPQGGAWIQGRLRDYLEDVRIEDGSPGTLFHNVLVSGRRVAAATVRGSPRA